MSSNLDIVRDYFAAIERGGSFEEVSVFFTQDVVQREFPNRFVPAGATRGLKELHEAAARGRAVIRTQRFVILDSVCQGDRVALEVQWTGTLAISLGKLAAGDAMNARFGVFLEFRNGKIARQHNYDCFDAF